MSEIMKKQDRALTEWTPMRAMREMLRWDPFREMAPMFTSLPFEQLTWTPSFDVTETKDAFVFKADVPGVKQEELAITMTGNRLQIAGKRDSEHEVKSDTAYTYERQFGSFTRSFTLPAGIDVEHAKSELANGVLTLIIPKRAEAQAKTIPIAAMGPKS